MNRRDRRRAARSGRATAPDLASTLAAGVAAHRAGRLEVAEDAYRRVLAADPRQPDALHLSGLIAHQRGDTAMAVAAIEAAVAARPDDAAMRANLAEVLRHAGRAGEALVQCEHAVRLAPDHAEAHNNRGNALRDLGRLEEAAAAFRAAADLDPPFLATALTNLGVVLNDLGRHAEAEAVLTRALTGGGDAETRVALARALSGLARHAEAVAACREVLATAPHHPGAAMALGDACRALGETAAAADAYRAALAVEPANPIALNNLGNALRELCEGEAAAACFHRAIALAPALAPAHANLGSVLTEQGRVAEACAAFRRALELDPGLAGVRSNLLLVLQYTEAGDAIAAEARAWNRHHGVEAPAVVPVRHRDPERRLRIGYVSPDLRRHSVVYFFEPLLAAHDRERFEVVCYADVRRADAVTERLRGLSERWVASRHLDTEAFAARVQADGIDILVDLAGHTAGNRLAAFARRLAPLQVSYLGYPDTTGLTAMDYRLTDAVADPPGEADRRHVETLVRLPGGFLCYRPPPVAPPAPRAGGPLTFGSFNHLPKVTPAVIAAWSRILDAVPGSRLLLKAKALAGASVRQRLAADFAAHGIAPERIETVGWIPDTTGHLALYGRVDIALDTFPYNGTTTTCEALWMGVPVVTLAGDRHAGRVGASLLHRLGLDALVAEDVDGYVARALALAADGGRRAALRGSLRDRFAASPLADAGRLAGAVEATYRAIWRRHIGGTAAVA